MIKNNLSAYLHDLQYLIGVYNKYIIYIRGALLERDLWKLGEQLGVISWNGVAIKIAQRYIFRISFPLSHKHKYRKDYEICFRSKDFLHFTCYRFYVSNSIRVHFPFNHSSSHHVKNLQTVLKNHIGICICVYGRVRTWR